MGGFGALSADGDFELNPLTIREGLIGGLHLSDLDVDVSTPLVWGNKSKPFVVIEPLYSSLRHIYRS